VQQVDVMSEHGELLEKLSAIPLQVIHVRIENEQVEAEPLLQRQPSMVSLPPSYDYSRAPAF
jgi:hypothetical protein